MRKLLNHQMNNLYTIQSIKLNDCNTAPKLQYHVAAKERWKRKGNEQETSITSEFRDTEVYSLKHKWYNFQRHGNHIRNAAGIKIQSFYATQLTVDEVTVFDNFGLLIIVVISSRREKVWNDQKVRKLEVVIQQLDNRGGKYFEDDAKVVSIERLNMVAFCHLQGMVHRDLKPEFFNNSSLQTGEDHPNFVRIMYLVVYLSISRVHKVAINIITTFFILTRYLASVLEEVLGGKYFEDDANVVSIETLNVVAFCHLQGMVHRDLNPEFFNNSSLQIGTWLAYGTMWIVFNQFKKVIDGCSTSHLGCGFRALAGISGQSNNLHDIVQEMLIMGNGNNIISVVRRLMLAACVYNLLKERNGRIFRDTKRNSDKVIRGIMNTVKSRLLGLTVRESKEVRATESKWGITLKRAKTGK
ncbi:hypothetical protein CTI12_AA130500 [Artemisia annua]|uniref:Protein kinase domain-containing protein n=1 Tax=Artemisia annua TaxID=35608 RepID=A0A2U1PLP5_ARTAN|nr:hypothetical protein CTI12_AA130500 [Artemisia annua]